MQFYKDGFRGGNPDIHPAAPNRRNRGLHEPVPRAFVWRRSCRGSLRSRR
jgi:hypothetical protein